MDSSAASCEGAIKLVALDLDGTTLNSSHELTTNTAEVLRRLSSDGVMIAIATGRSAPSVFGYVDELALGKNVPAICYNGSFGFMVETNDDGTHSAPRQLFSMPIPVDRARLLLNLAEKMGLVAQYYNGETGDVQAVPTTDEHRTLMKRYEELVGKPQVIVESYEEAIGKSPAAKLLILTNEPDLLIETAKKELPEGVFHIIRGSPHPFFVEFLPLEVSKGEGLRRLCECIGIPIESVVAFGDGENDQEMLHLAGVGVAMGNARPAAKNNANVVLEWTNDEEGVAKHLERMEQQGQFALRS